MLGVFGVHTTHFHASMKFVVFTGFARCGKGRTFSRKNINVISVYIIFRLGRSTCTLYMICGGKCSTTTADMVAEVPPQCDKTTAFYHHSNFKSENPESKTTTLFHQIWKVVALFAITFLIWWHFPPPLFHFDGTFRHHDFFHSDLSGGTFCHHFAGLAAFSAITFPFWWHFPPPWLFHPDLSGGAFCHHFHVLTSLFAPHFFGSDLSGGAFRPHTNETALLHPQWRFPLPSFSSVSLAVTVP